MMLSPSLAVADIDRSIRFYRDTLGFQEEFKLSGPDGQLVHASVRWGESHLMFGTATLMSSEARVYLGTGVEFYFMYKGDIDAYFAELEKKGVDVISAPQDQFWGDRNFSIQDPDGYRLTFAKQVREVSMEEMMSAMEELG